MRTMWRALHYVKHMVWVFMLTSAPGWCYRASPMSNAQLLSVCEKEDVLDDVTAMSDEEIQALSHKIAEDIEKAYRLVCGASTESFEKDHQSRLYTLLLNIRDEHRDQNIDVSMSPQELVRTMEMVRKDLSTILTELLSQSTQQKKCDFPCIFCKIMQSTHAP